MTLIAGIDEAGRGPCFGPMTISVALIDDKDEAKLKEIGVKDSKEITPKGREKLFDLIQDIIIEHRTIIVPPIEINDLMTHYTLNEIEEMKMAELIEGLKKKPEVIYIDCPEKNGKKFEAKVRSFFSKDMGKTKAKELEKIKVIAENKADANYVVVGAASILAKVTRDREIEKLQEKFGAIGSGYPSDPHTVAYLEKYVAEHKKLPPFSRIFWANCKLVMDKKDSKQSKLF